MPPIRGVNVCVCVCNTWLPCWSGRNVRGWCRCGWEFCNVLRTQPPVTLKGANVSRKGIKSGECAAIIKPASLFPCFLCVRVCAYVCLHTTVEQRNSSRYKWVTNVCRCFVVFAKLKWLIFSLYIHFYKVLFSHVPYNKILRVEMKLMSEVNVKLMFFIYFFFFKSKVLFFFFF